MKFLFYSILFEKLNEKQKKLNWKKLKNPQEIEKNDEGKGLKRRTKHGNIGRNQQSAGRRHRQGGPVDTEIVTVTWMSTVKGVSRMTFFLSIFLVKRDKSHVKCPRSRGHSQGGGPATVKGGAQQSRGWCHSQGGTVSKSDIFLSTVHGQGATVKGLGRQSRGSVVVVSSPSDDDTTAQREGEDTIQGGRKGVCCR